MWITWTTKKNNRPLPYCFKEKSTKSFLFFYFLQGVEKQSSAVNFIDIPLIEYFTNKSNTQF